MAQKILEKQIDAIETKQLVIASDMINLLSIATEKTDQIKMITKIAGENSENVIVTASEENNILTIGTAYTPYFSPENDKLAAHKILSIEMQLIIPDFLIVEIDTKTASIEATGTYDVFRANLDYGNCELNNFLGHAMLRTVHGNILVHAQEHVSGRAFSKKGSVLNYLPGRAKYTIIAESRDGDISLFQTK
jgi:hypothetical protein